MAGNILLPSPYVIIMRQCNTFEGFQQAKHHMTTETGCNGDIFVCVVLLYALKGF